MEPTVGKKIAYLVGTFPALSETFILRELNFLLENGLEVSVYAIRRADSFEGTRPLCTPALISGCRYARPDHILRHLADNLLALILHPVRYARALRVFLRSLELTAPKTAVQVMYHFVCGIGFGCAMRRAGVRHIHSHFSAGSDLALAASLYTGIPFSFTAHASDDIFTHPALLTPKLEHCRFAVPVSQYSARFLDSITARRYTEKVHSIYNGVSVSECVGIASPPRLERTDESSERPLRIVSVGRLAAIKGHGTLIEACHLLQQRSVRFSCCIIGEGPELKFLRRLIEALDLSDAVTLTGSMDLQRVYSVLRQSDLFVLLSEISARGHRDCLPTAILEAMLAGLPVVSTYVSAIPEIVEHQVTGMLVPERSPGQAADAIERLARNPALRRQYGEAGRERVLQYFNSQINLRELLGLFAASLDGHRAPATTRNRQPVIPSPAVSSPLR